MKKTTSCHLTSLLLLAFVGSSFAQRHETFAERPSKRQERVQIARERATREKEEAHQWAAARGLKMRHDDGHRLVELMAIRNGRPIYYATDNADAAVSTAADQVRNTAPFNVDGSGVTVGVWDGGSVYSIHREFGNRVSLENPGASVHYHATHVAGTIGAAGITARAEGMAPATGIDSYYWSGDEGEMAAAGAAAAGEVGKIYLSNHSYGTLSGWAYARAGNGWSGNAGYHWYGNVNTDTSESFFGQYSSSVRDWDQIVYDAPYYLPFKSAGNDRSNNPSSGSTVYYTVNVGSSWLSASYSSALHPKGDGIYKDGYDTIATKGNAKNIMTVGAIDDAENGTSRTLSYPYAQMSSFSGWGPTDDGRIKPDIVANGVGLYSCDDDNTAGYASVSGTSMACPNACGSAALLVDYYDDLFPGGAMWASTLKGLIIHTADDLGRPGPDYSYGWGLMNTLAAAELLGDSVDNPTRLVEATVTTAQKSDTYTFFSDGNEPVRATLCWTDPPGISTSVHDSRTSRLVNDLELKVAGPGGTYYPYKLDYSNPSANATTGENNVDNVEQVYIATPVAGQYTITVNFDGTSVSGGEQWYSLLISGPGGDVDGDGMPNSWELQYFGNATNAVASADSDGDGVDNLSEYITGYSPIDPDSVFKVILSGLSEAGSVPYIMTWNPVAGRIYDVSWSPNLVITPFEPLLFGVDLPFTQNSYTDTVERTGLQNFYRVDVRLDQ